MAGELGKASLDLEANLGPFERNLETAHGASDRLEHALDALAAVADVCQKSLNDVKMGAAQGAESRVSAEQILSGVHGISDEARTAAREIDRVKLGSEQATETEVAGSLIDHKLDEIRDSAERTQRALDGVRLRLAVAGGGGHPTRPGYGVGPFGAGYGRLGLVGTAVGLGVATVPAAAPAALGLLAAIPTMGAAAAGALGVLALAGQGVAKAIGGDKKAFDELTPSAQKFVLTVRSLDGFMDKLKQKASAAIFPGITAGLKAALSPGTVAAVEKAIVEIGKALGSVGAQFGRYFGSGEFQKIFGPLMAAAARNIRVMGDALLHLFDALGVLGRAAIPFTNWLVSVVDKGSKLADSWIHAKAASGELSGALDKAKGSLILVAHLAGALVGVVVQLGKALYPVSSIIVKDLTVGLDALGKAIGKAAPDIRSALGGALGVLVAIVKTAGPALGTLVDVLLKLVGVAGRALVPVIRALAPLFKAIQTVLRSLEPPLAKIIRDLGHSLAPIVKALAKPMADFVRAMGPVLVGALKVLDPLLRATLWGVLQLAKGFGYLEELSAKALRFIEKHWHGIGSFFRGLGHAIVNAFKVVWHNLERGALKAALAIVEPFSHLPKWLGGGPFQRMKASLQSTLARMDKDTQSAANRMGDSFAGMAKKTTSIFASLANSAAAALNGVAAAFRAAGKHIRQQHHHHHHAQPKVSTADVFGTPPPFTKNTGSGSGSGSAIPGTVSHLRALASQQASMAATARTVAAARKHLQKELDDLVKAEKILEQKLKHAHGAAKTTLFNALTSVENKIRSVRKQLRDEASKSGVTALDYALDKAKLAVEKAKEGSKAYDNAVAAEEKALKAEIRYWDKRAHNAKLSRDARDAAIRKELQYERELKQLEKKSAQAAVANEKQFLSTFADITGSFGSNASPIDGGSPKTNTHLHEIKNEARQTNRHLRDIRDKARFAHSDLGQDSALAVVG